MLRTAWRTAIVWIMVAPSGNCSNQNDNTNDWQGWNGIYKCRASHLSIGECLADLA